MVAPGFGGRWRPGKTEAVGVRQPYALVERQGETGKTPSCVCTHHVPTVSYGPLLTAYGRIEPKIKDFLWLWLDRSGKVWQGAFLPCGNGRLISVVAEPAFGSHGGSLAAIYALQPKRLGRLASKASASGN
jgi:hypothetical protein